MDGFTEVNSLANLFMSDLGLFYIRVLDEGEKLRNMRSEYAILPVPKFDAAQKEYYCPSACIPTTLFPFRTMRGTDRTAYH